MCEDQQLTQTKSLSSMPKYDYEAFGSALIIFSVICAGANAALICSFIYHKKYKKNYHLAYLNLAVTDLVLALFGFTVRGPGKHKL